jgi:hypothetical protein
MKPRRYCPRGFIPYDKHFAQKQGWKARNDKQADRIAELETENAELRARNPATIPVVQAAASVLVLRLPTRDAATERNGLVTAGNSGGIGSGKPSDDPY